MFLVELIASSFLISKQARRKCRCKRVLVLCNFGGHIMIMSSFEVTEGDLRSPFVVNGSGLI